MNKTTKETTHKTTNGLIYVIISICKMLSKMKQISKRSYQPMYNLAR